MTFDELITPFHNDAMNSPSTHACRHARFRGFKPNSHSVREAFQNEENVSALFAQLGKFGGELSRGDADG